MKSKMGFGQGWPSTLDKVSMADIDTLKVSMSIDPINHRHFNFFLKKVYTHTLTH